MGVKFAGMIGDGSSEADFKPSMMFVVGILDFVLLLKVRSKPVSACLLGVRDVQVL